MTKDKLPPRPALEGDVNQTEKTKCTCMDMVIGGQCSYCLDREIVRLTRLAHQLSAQLAEARKALGEARQEIEEMKDDAYHAGIERDLAT
jgi:hypothetical protein